jgi:hypothetical protein
MKHLTGSKFQCPWCLEHYAGPVPFGQHYDPTTAECLSPEQMRSAGMALNTAGFWTIDAPRSIDNRTHSHEVSA